MSQTALQLPPPTAAQRLRDHLLRSNIPVLDPTPAQRLRGVDLCPVFSGRPMTVEVRAQSGEFDLAIIEIRSDAGTGRLGWGYQSHADRVAIVLEELDLVYWIHPNMLRKRLPEWERRATSGGEFERIEVERSPGHVAVELVVPMTALEDIAEAALCL